MRMVDATQPPKMAKKPEAPNIQHLMDKGLMEGFSFDAADQAVSTRVQNLSSSTAGIPDINLSSSEGGWIRQMLPSKGIPYNRTDAFWVRPFDVETLARVHAAQQVGEKGNSQQAFTMLLDALAPTIKDFDIRDLTVPDFYAFLYWLRINSYTRSPFTINWTSKYGNENAKRLTMSSFEFKELDISFEDYFAWRKRGITFPTVRDMEILNDDEIPDVDRWKMTYAQYVYVEGPIKADFMRRKVARFMEMGTDAVPDINEFTKLTAHGVIEQVRVKDEKFEPQAAITFLTDQINTLAHLLEVALMKAEERDDDSDLKKFFYMHSHLEELNRLHKDIEKAVENNLPYQPEEEVVTLAPANATMLFP